MLVYIIHSDKIHTFKLPKEISGNYILNDYDSLGNSRSLINIDAVSGAWVACSNADVQIKINSNVVQTVEIKMYQYYQLVINGVESVLLFIAPATEKPYAQRKLKDGASIIMGSDSNCDICYTYAGIAPQQLQLTFSNGKYFFKNLNTQIPIFVNKVKKSAGFLKSFDTIFIVGLKIVINGSNIIINNPNNLLQIFDHDKLENPRTVYGMQTYQTGTETYSDFYDSKEYYIKAPTFQKKIKDLTVTIANPPSKSNDEKPSMLMTIVPTIIMSASSLFMGYNAIKNLNSGQNTDSAIGSLIMCVALLLGSIVWPFIDRSYNEKKEAENEEKRVRLFSNYLEKKAKILDMAVKEQKIDLNYSNVPLKECQNIILNRSSSLYSRSIEHDDFLNIRLGTGRVPLECTINYSAEEYSQYEDVLVERINEIIDKHKYIEDAAYKISLAEKKVVVFLGNVEVKEKYMNAIILQLLTFQSYSDLKIIVLTDESSDLSYLRESIHCWNNDKSFRFFATKLDEGEEISSYLEKEFSSRLDNNKEGSSYKNFDQYYLIISDSISRYRNLKIIKDILNNKSHLGFGMIVFDSKLANVPNGCFNFIDYNELEANFFQAEMDSSNIQKFKPEFITEDINVEECCRILANIPIKNSDNSGNSLPEYIGFLEMYGIGKVEQLNSLRKWEEFNLVNSLAAPIGVDGYGNLLNLDLHEKKHGPHGLIAGMTGSGKSELIITYILSLAVNYSPYEVQFVLIDYKGGGLAGAFENRKTRESLPHLVGTITNLDKSEMKRTLVSIQSELQRRQRLFNDAKEQLNTGTIDIYKYQRLVRDGSLSEPLSHLFIICDEFAELKSQQPEFMDQLVSTARIGRSLGIHLILATQKPSGVVDDQIWSNSKFKICCKVQTTEDSNEMIRRPDAASLKEAGRFFMQVGYDEYFVLAQSSYTGASYIPSDKKITKIDNSISFVNNLGQVVKNAKEEKKETKINLGEELTNVLKYLIKIAGDNNIKASQLWLDNIPPIIYIDEVRKKYNVPVEPYIIDTIIGEYDDPKNQRQGYVSIPITKNGNTSIIGVAGSGKSTLLSTFMYATLTTHSTDEVNMYVVDLGTETLKKFDKAPQVGAVLTITDGEEISKLFYMLGREKVRRKKYLSDNGGTFSSAVSMGKKDYPNIIVVINGMEIFREQFEKLYEEIFVQLTRDCNKMGIYFIVTGTSLSSIGYMAENNFTQKIVLKLNDPGDYYSAVGTNNVIPSDNPGRGVIPREEAYEFQTALISEHRYLDQTLAYIFEQINKFVTKKAPSIPQMPEMVNISSVKEVITTLDMVPVGLDLKTIEPTLFNFENYISLISGIIPNSITSFANALIEVLADTEDVKPIVLNASEKIKISVSEKVKYYDAGFKELTKALLVNIKNFQGVEGKKDRIPIIIIGYGKIQSALEKASKEDVDTVTIDNLIMASKTTEIFKFIFIDEYKDIRGIQSREWSMYLDTTSGIWLGKGFDDQLLLETEKAYNEDLTSQTKGVVLKNGKVEYMKYLQ